MQAGVTKQAELCFVYDITGCDKSGHGRDNRTWPWVGWYVSAAKWKNSVSAVIPVGKSDTKQAASASALTA